MSSPAPAYCDATAPAASVEMKRPVMETKPVSSVDNALHVLQLFKSRRVLRVADVADDLGVARSTAHRLLVALVQRGFAAQERVTRAYIPGPELMEIGLAVVDMLDIRGRARPFMTALADELHETVSLVVLEGANARFVDSIESPQVVRVSSRTGQVLPAHCVSGGKVLLSTLSRDGIDHLYHVEELPTLTPYSISTKTALLEALDEIRERGYSTNEAESEPDVCAAAVALQMAGSAAAVTVAAPSSRVQTGSVDDLGLAIQRIVEAVQSGDGSSTISA
jgi:DNA-binding IclR family transcriptional regulator